jgi:hypothetical protein
MYPEIRLKTERNVSVANRHPWIFSGALKTIPEGIINGAIALGKFAYAVYQHLRNNKAERLTLQTPLRTVEIQSSDAVSEERVLAPATAASHSSAVGNRLPAHLAYASASWALSPST